MRFLITGAAGFIGSHLADRLIELGHTVWGVDNLSTGRRDNVNDKVAFYDCDIVNRHLLYEIANYCNPDVVVHCAASYSDPNKWHRDVDSNVAGTINATLVAKHHGARLVYFQTALPPISSYAISKIAGEQYINLSGVPALIFRLSNIYGPRNLSGPIPTFYRRLTTGEPCTVTDTRRDLVYIDDLIHLVVSGIGGEATGKYDVCSGHQWPIHFLYDEVRGNLGLGHVEAREIPAPADDVAQMQLDPAAAEADFGWRPVTLFTEGVRAAVDWYRSNGVGATYTHLNLKG